MLSACFLLSDVESYDHDQPTHGWNRSVGARRQAALVGMASGDQSDRVDQLTLFAWIRKCVVGIHNHLQRLLITSISL